MKSFQIIALTLPAMPDPSIAIAASRAGGIGVLDLEYLNDREAALKTIHRLAKFAHNEFGVKIAAANAGLVADISPDMIAQLKFVLLTFQDPKTLKNAIAVLQHRGLSVWVECTHIDQAMRAEKWGADGVIAKGHEAGGRVGNETAFILVQQFTRNLSLPVWAQGGIGLHTAAACHAAGVAGIVIDAQLALTRESALSEDIKSKIARMDGTETLLLGEEIGEPYRVCSRLSLPAVQALKQKERILIKAKNAKAKTVANWNQAISRYIFSNLSEHQLFLFGQDIAFAAPLADRFVTVGGILQAFRQAADSHRRAAGLYQPLTEGSPLAQSHGTRYPVVQGPMARVSDNATFVSGVAQQHALPFVAAAWMRQHELDPLLEEVKTRLDGVPWGVGLLGFLPSEVYQEQIKTILKYRPPFALIAGGQPNQAKTLEQEGIATYLHVPSPGLLRMFLDSGVKRFVLEGRESGGHIGPLCSFVLWELMIEVLLQYLKSGKRPDEYHVLFAGGIHDARSAAMVAVMAATLAEQGVRVGIQLGSAYLFTEEAVTTGAIVRKYADEAIRSSMTTVLESGPGHAVRCLNNAFAKAFQREKSRLISKDFSTNEIHNELHRMQLGRMRIASKGIARNSRKSQRQSAPRTVRVSDDQQGKQGMYLIGQIAALKDRMSTVAELHQNIVKGCSEIIQGLMAVQGEGLGFVEGEIRPADIAIIGMACHLPKAPDVQQYWENILNKVSAIEEIPIERWDWRQYYSTDPHEPDKVCSKWGAFVDDICFDPLQYGITPKSLASIEPLQLLTLEVASRALEDAGYKTRPFPRHRTAVILGISGVADLSQLYSFRSALPMFIDDSSGDIISRFNGVLPQWTEDSFPGILPNVTAGRIANRLDLGGTNFAVDGACASSLAAVYLATRELETHAADMVLVGGADAMQNPFTYLCFSNTQALSPRGKCCPLDEQADGIVIGEGISVVALKRLEDAERDGDRIYAVIKGVGAASDGKDRSLTAPRPQGQVLALERAYRHANFSPATVGLFEAHATGTTVGDRAEIESLSTLLGKYKAKAETCAIGSVKSMIGHTKSTAGVASLIKVAMSLHHKILPPTLGVENPNAALRSPESALYVNSEARPWIRANSDHARRAGVSAFGFGGTNFHVVMEEYTGEYLEHLKTPSFKRWPSELFIFSARSRNDIIESIAALEKALRTGGNPTLATLSHSYAYLSQQVISQANNPCKTLAIVTSSTEDLLLKLSHAQDALKRADVDITDPRGIYYSEQPLNAEGDMAFLFPGQGSQYVNMLADLTLIFPEMQAYFTRSDRILQNRLNAALSSYLFAKPAFGAAEKNGQEQALAQTQIAQPAMGTADLAMCALLKSFGLQPDMVAGHSYGEYVALCAAGVIQETDLIRLSEARARFIARSAGPDPGAMAAVFSDFGTVEKIIARREGIWIANVNAPDQIVISGTQPAIEAVLAEFTRQGIQTRMIPVSCAFHSPLMVPAREQLMDFLTGIKLHAPHVKVFSNTSAQMYPKNPETIADQLVEHLVSRVEFSREIEAMYADGARIFLEVGPGQVLTRLVDGILGNRSHLAVNTNQRGRSGLVQLLHMLGQLAAHGVALKLEKLFKQRQVEHCAVDALLAGRHKAAPSPTAWLVNGSRSAPLSDLSVAKPEQRATPIRFTAAEGIQAQFSAPTGQLQSVESQIRRLQQTHLPEASAPSGNLENAPSARQPFARDGMRQVMNQYHRVLQRLVENQKRVMLDYFRGATGSAEPSNLFTDDTLKPSSIQPLSSTEDLQVGSSGEQDRIIAKESLSGQVPIASSTDPEVQADGDPDSPSADELPPDGQTLTLKLLEIVSECTGYQQDFLDLDTNLEADLGIDSIKRVEILGHFHRFAFGTENDELPEDIGDVSDLKTLRNIIDHVEIYRGAFENNPPEEFPASAAPPAPTPSPGFKKTPLLPRFTLSTVDAPLSNQFVQLSSDRVIVITDDGGGIAEALKLKLMRSGYKAAIIRFGDTPGKKKQKFYSLAENFAEAVSEPVETIRKRYGPLGGIVHLLPLRRRPHFEEFDMFAWQERLQLEIKTLFYLLKLSEDDLRQAAGEGTGFVVSATGMGGSFGCGSNSSPEDFFPGAGAIPGLLKTVDAEWPEIKVKSVDLNLKQPHSNLVNHLLAEIQTDDGLVEVGYDGLRRLTLGLVDAPLLDEAQDVVPIDSSWVILVTGGARGITAEVAGNLAQRYRPTLILAGRSALPPEKESDATAKLVDPQELKSALYNEMKGHSERVELKAVAAAYDRLCKQREIRSNIAAMRQAGAQVVYAQIDIRDQQQFGSLIDEIYQTHGRLDGVIHGAGIIEDKLLKDKTWDSFERVLGTKADSVFILSRKLRSQTLKFLVLFSSVAGRFGNRGQSDYTAANEVVNKMAVYLNNHWPGRVASINWGPWDTAGMVSNEVKRQFAQREYIRFRLMPVPGYSTLNCAKVIKKTSKLLSEMGPGETALCWPNHL
jgi:acyl transferase domain-containing protein/NAD(P)H-dependent flavin oxidoreductase YrpB (nitropropane dioxygenase family)/NAD(P)-dependent dehydrogenase (short-subunit alcohol dehydrogenase family)/acyl carrier protein